MIGILPYVAVVKNPQSRLIPITAFFDFLPGQLRTSIEVVAIDMWDPYIKAVKESCPDAKIVFDRFHTVAAFGRVDEHKDQRHQTKSIWFS